MAAAAATKKNQQAAATTPVVDPKFEWEEKAGSFVLRLALPGFRKDDFRVQLDGADRLTVWGTRTGTAGHSSFNKVFQLPASASLDDISGRFEAGVLTLTVPKRASSAPTPTSIEDIKGNQHGVAKEEGVTGGDKKGDAGVKKTEAKEETGKEATLKKAMEAATNKAQQQKKRDEEEANRRKQEQQKSAPVPAAKKEEDVKPKAPQAAAAVPPPPKPEAVTGGEKAKAAVAPESLAERVRRRGEEEHANAAPMATAKRAKTDGENKTTAAYGGWKERMQGELKVLTDMKWADGLVEAARKNKEVVAVGIAAFSLGFLVSNKLLRK